MNQGLIAVEGMKFYAFHGYHAIEHKIGGSYLVDVYIHTSLKKASESDELKDTINYERIYQLVKSVMDESYHLLEHVAGEIIDHLVQTGYKMSRIRVRVSKLNPPIPGEVQRTYVELEREM